MRWDEKKNATVTSPILHTRVNAEKCSRSYPSHTRRFPIVMNNVSLICCNLPMFDQQKANNAFIFDLPKFKLWIHGIFHWYYEIWMGYVCACAYNLEKNACIVPLLTILMANELNGKNDLDKRTRRTAWRNNENSVSHINKISQNFYERISVREWKRKKTKGEEDKKKKITHKLNPHIPHEVLCYKIYLKIK